MLFISSLILGLKCNSFANPLPEPAGYIAKAIVGCLCKCFTTSFTVPSPPTTTTTLIFSTSLSNNSSTSLIDFVTTKEILGSFFLRYPITLNGLPPQNKDLQ